MALIGLDVGTSGCKCIIFGDGGGVMARQYREYPVVNPGPGLFELDPEGVWEAVKTVIGKAVRDYRGEKITALCLSSFGEAGVPVDRAGRVLDRSLLYTDGRGGAQCERLKNALGPTAIMHWTGLHAHPMYSINKLMWLRENRPEIYRDTWKFMLFEDFILFRLGGAAAIDYSLASRTMAFNVTRKEWQAEIFEAAGVAEDIFSTPVPGGTAIGAIKPEVAAELQLPRDLQLVTGGHDQVCAAVGGGIIGEGLAINGMGTVECITPAFAGPKLDQRMFEANFACVPHPREGMFVTYAFNFTGGALLKWYRDSFASWEGTAAGAARNFYAAMDARAAAGPTRLLVLPHFAGAGTPFMDTQAKGAIIGLGLDSDASQIYRAMLEGVTYEMLFNVEALETAGIGIRELRAVGGGAKSDLWLQIKADIMGRKVTALEVEEAGALGAAMLAGTATGLYPSLEKAAETLVRIKKEFHPDPANHSFYRENYRRYRKMYAAVREVML